MRVFCGVLRVFCSISTKHTKHPKNIEKHLKTQKNSQYARVLRAFSKSQKFRLYCTKHLSQNICKTPQNTAKQSQNAFCENTSQNIAKQTQNAQKVTKPSHYSRNTYCLRAFGVFFKNTLNLSQKYTLRNTRKLRITRGVTYPRRGSRFKKNSVLRCFAVFCGVLRCFVCVFLAFFTKQHITDQKIYKTHKTNKIRFVQYSAIRCCASFSHSENVVDKNIRKTRPKHCKTSAKHRKTLFFETHLQNTAKHPQNTRKTPQNIAKHHKTDLLTKQTELANNPLRSPERGEHAVTMRERGGGVAGTVVARAAAASAATSFASSVSASVASTRRGQEEAAGVVAVAAGAGGGAWEPPAPSSPTAVGAGASGVPASCVLAATSAILRC